MSNNKYIILCFLALVPGYLTQNGLEEQHTDNIDYHNFNTNPKYNFGYGVHDPESGDEKEHYEERDGDAVKGSYSLKEADGSIRIVEYTADSKNGFQAVVRTIRKPKQEGTPALVPQPTSQLSRAVSGEQQVEQHKAYDVDVAVLSLVVICAQAGYIPEYSGNELGGYGGEEISYGGHHVEEHHEEEYHEPKKYQFNYAVHDPHTGDEKSQYEERDGDVVKGQYSLREADGTMRIVEYKADKHNGFTAVVHKVGEPKKHEEQVVYGGHEGYEHY
ncbi:unnamed protein product [Brassicogethes aeneus]|uniref:Uncharacterized protein n=1 Tax=Brassicogethes aeneus TaxID=1431903 RepID=A0A9P0AXZ2_BRAAE|nr:unnamed protein product [Brassicogethes aeneus]